MMCLVAATAAAAAAEELWVFPPVTLSQPSGDPQDFGATIVVDVETSSGAGALAPLVPFEAAGCIDTKEAIQKYGCAAHVEDAFAVCAMLETCVAVQCLPTDTFELSDQSDRAARLREAADRGDAENVARELRRDPSMVDGADNRGRTPLMLAARAGSIEAVAELVAFGAKVLAADTQGLTARDLAHAPPHLAPAVVRDATRHEIAALLDAAASRESIATTRLDDGRVDDAAPMLVRRALARDAIARFKASKNAAQLEAAVRGPLCLFASDTRDGDHFQCDGNATLDVYAPRRRCTRHVMRPARIADALDLRTLPAPAVRAITNARREHRAVFVYDDAETWRLPDVANGRAYDAASNRRRRVSIVDGAATAILGPRR
ncbi:hypothetical protein CTAYLR_000026 [Chrysophaeum taylorii]|uniref:Uncharacterized protein n=1 Tax=Chrysophaeum taylorii TaxID=2483200 RepID=A0AAD7XQQ6_9STRA|nr:hypothetical protein CTAYLR_000026 [Chrysophaeum taylorii]